MNTNFDTIINFEKPILIDFLAIWCGSCKTLAPILKQVKDSPGERIIKADNLIRVVL